MIIEFLIYVSYWNNSKSHYFFKFFSYFYANSLKSIWVIKEGRIVTNFQNPNIKDKILVINVRYAVISEFANPLYQIKTIPKIIYGISSVINLCITKNTLWLIFYLKKFSTLYGLIISSSSLSALHSNKIEASIY